MDNEALFCSAPILEAMQSLQVSSAQATATSPSELSGDPNLTWESGRTLKVKFLDGDPAVQAKVEKLAREWSKYANIKFEFGNAPDSEIRISFKVGGSWSYLGKDALKIRDQDAPTMNYGWLRPNSSDQEYSRVVLHEFGHALGFIHEHKSPKAGIPWNEKAVLKYYKDKHGWDEKKTRRNVLEVASKDSVRTSKFDKSSIMLYSIPNELTNGDFSVGWNTELSDTDKSFARELYPFADDDKEVFIPFNKGAGKIVYKSDFNSKIINSAYQVRPLLRANSSAFSRDGHLILRGRNQFVTKVFFDIKCKFPHPVTISKVSALGLTSGKQTFNAMNEIRLSAQYDFDNALISKTNNIEKDAFDKGGKIECFISNTKSKFDRITEIFIRFHMNNFSGSPSARENRFESFSIEAEEA